MSTSMVAPFLALVTVLQSTGGGLQPDSVAAVVLVERPWSPVVVVSASLPFGTGHDPQGQEGSAWVLAHSVVEGSRAPLERMSSDLRAEVGVGRTDFTLVAPSEVWAEAWKVLSDALFAGGFPDDAISEVRSGLEEQLRFEAGSPGRAFRDEAQRFFYGQDHPWARAPQGSLDSVTRISSDAVRRLQREHLVPGRASVAVVGRTTPEYVSRFIGPLEQHRDRPEDAPLAAADSLRPPVETLIPEPSPSPAPTMAWARGERSLLVREVTSTWIAVALPVPGGAPRIPLEMLAFTIREDLTPATGDPGLYWLRVALDDGPAGELLRISAAVDPGAADRWEARILESVHSARTITTPDPFFQWQRRRFRNRRLLDDASGVADAQRTLSDVLLGTAPEDVFQKIWDLSPADVRSVAESLGEPKVLVFGPDLTGEAGQGG